jgi:hypothetical protein
LLGGAELQEIWENCRKKGELWAEIQFAQIKADAKRKEILSEKEWENYLIWKLNMEAKVLILTLNPQKNPALFSHFPAFCRC